MKDLIINKAAERFARYGFHKTTIEDIAKDLNKVKSALYYYFKTKEEIFKAVIDFELEKFSVIIRDSLEKEKNPKDKLFAFITSHLQAFGKLTKEYSTLLDLYFSEHNIVQNARDIYDKRELSVIKNILEEGIKEKVFNIKDINTTSLVILTSIKGVEQEFVSEKDLKNIKILSETMAHIIIKGISKE